MNLLGLELEAEANALSSTHPCPQCSAVKVKMMDKTIAFDKLLIENQVGII